MASERSLLRLYLLVCCAPRASAVPAPPMATAAERAVVHAAGAPLLLAEDWRALGFSTLAGLATAIGGVIAVIRRPEAALLAFMLGLAIGVMATLSVLELMIQNAIDNGAWQARCVARAAVPAGDTDALRSQVGLCATLGGAFYVCVEPLMPHGNVLEVRHAATDVCGVPALSARARRRRGRTSRAQSLRMTAQARRRWLRKLLRARTLSDLRQMAVQQVPAAARARHGRRSRRGGSRGVKLRAVPKQRPLRQSRWKRRARETSCVLGARPARHCCLHRAEHGAQATHGCYHDAAQPARRFRGTRA